MGWPAGTLRGRRTSSSNGSQAMVRHPAVLTALASESARISIEKFPRSTEELGVYSASSVRPHACLACRARGIMDIPDGVGTELVSRLTGARSGKA